MLARHLLLSPSLAALSSGTRGRVASCLSSKAAAVDAVDVSAWHASLRSLPPHALRACLPLPHPSGGNWANEEALLGDALLKVALYRALGLGETSDGSSRQRPLDKGRLHDLAANALSNTRLAECAQPLLVGPGLLTEDDLAALPSDHTRGTCVEAAAAAVGTLRDADRALACVAEMLLANSDSRPTPQLHPKTWLLELGGRVTSSREGGEDHMPLWVAEAECFGKKHRVGPLASKKLAEAAAAEGLLRKLSIMM